MREGIHPAIRRDAGHLRLRQPLHHPQHEGQRVHHRRGLLGLPPLLHGQAEDPRLRRPRRALRGALRQAEPGQEVAAQTAPIVAVGAVVMSGEAIRSPIGGRSQTDARSMTVAMAWSGRRQMAAPTVDALLMEYAELERALADPSVHADAGAGPQAGAALRRARPGRRRRARAGRRPRRRGRRARARRRGPRLRRRGRRAAGPHPRAGDPAGPAARPARPARRRRRRHGDQVGGGWRGVGAVRGRSRAHVHALRRAARMEGRGARRGGQRPWRRQGHDDGGALPQAPIPTACGPR